MLLSSSNHNGRFKGQGNGKIIAMFLFYRAKKGWKRLLSVIGLCITSLLLMSFFHSCTINEFISNEYGYNPINPPSKLLSPGTIVLIRDKEPFRASVICRQEGALGEEVDLINSDTIEVSRLSRETFNLPASLGLEINSKLKAEFDLQADYLKDFNLSLTNPKLFELIDEEVQKRKNNFSPDCAQIVSARLEEGYELTMIRSVIQADATFKLSLETNLDLDLDLGLQFARSIAPELMANFTKVTQDTVVGENLYWGVTDDEFLFLTVARAMGATLPVEESVFENLSSQESEERRLLPKGQTVEIVP